MLKKSALISSLLVASVFASSAFAAEVSVSKLRVNLENGQTAEFLTLHNESETAKEAFEISLHKWTQTPNTSTDPKQTDKPPMEVLEDTTALLVSPKTVVIMPKQEKIIRIIVDDADKAQSDYSYRMIINQLPNREVDVQKNTVNLLFKISLPVFVYKDAIKKIDKMSVPYTLSEEGGKSYITFKNNDTQHVQLQELEVNGAKSSINHYLLPGTTDKIELPAEFKKANLKDKPLTIVTDKGTLKITN